MIYRFTIISDEVDDFVREIQIDADATFLDFQKEILKSTGYSDKDITLFYTCNDYWEKEKMISIEEMESNSDEDTWIMEDTPLSELLEDEKQRLIFIFDMMTERCFFIELSEIIYNKSMKKAKCTRKEGEAPQQFINFDDYKPANSNIDLDENFYGDEGFDLDEFDKDGFSGLEDTASSMDESY